MTIGYDDRFSTTVVPQQAPESADLGAYDGSNVAARMGFDDAGASAADSSTTGDLANPGSSMPTMPQDGQGGNDSKQERETGDGPAAPSIIGLLARWWRGGLIAQDANDPGIIEARAGRPTDPGRPARATLRDGIAPSTWDQVDDGMGMKHDTASPLAYSGSYGDSPVKDGLASPGGNMPAAFATDPLQINTYRVPPTPWDDANYIGGPFDG